MGGKMLLLFKRENYVLMNIGGLIKDHKIENKARVAL
jgi:hypothetical protein